MKPEAWNCSTLRMKSSAVVSEVFQGFARTILFYSQLCSRKFWIKSSYLLNITWKIGNILLQTVTVRMNISHNVYALPHEVPIMCVMVQLHGCDSLAKYYINIRIETYKN